MKPARPGETVLRGGFFASKTRNDLPQKRVTKRLKNT